MKSYLRILKLVARYRGLAVLNVTNNLLYAVFSLFGILLVIPFLQVLFGQVSPPEQAPEWAWNIRQIVEVLNYRFGSYITEHGETSGLIMVCVVVISIFFLKNLFRYLASYFLAPLRNGVVRDLRSQIFGKSVELPVAWYSERRKGDVMARMTTDVQEVESSILNTLEAALREPLLIIFYLVAMLVISPQLTLFVLLLLPITGGIIGTVGKSLKRPSRMAMDRIGVLLSLIEETIGGLRIVKGFNAEELQKSRFDQINQEHYELQNRFLRRRYLSSPMSEFLGITVVAVVLWFGGKMVLGGSFSAEVFIGYILIFANLINPAKAFANAWYHIQRGMASMERIEALLLDDTDREERTTVLPEIQQGIEYRGVGFSYDEKPVLQDINIEVKHGQMMALVGQSGAGKSTLVDLLPRFYEAGSGEIRIDGQDIREVSRKSLRKQMGIVTQESVLFHDTVHANIAFGKADATRAEVEEAAKVANAHTFISKLPQGYNTVIGDRGTKLSGGERQRLTIARAILKNPPILILDEATSNLDTESEKLVQDALSTLMKNRTSLVIAHRLSTIQDADHIVVMKEGRIVEEGTHQELLSQNGVYCKLVEMQAF